MTKNEKAPFSLKSCCSKKGRIFFWLLILFVLLAAIGYVGIVRYSWPSFGTQESAKLSAIEQRLEAMEKRLDTAVLAQTQATGEPIPLNEEFNKLKAQVEDTDSKSQMVAQKFIAEAFAFWDLREAVKSGASFVPQLAAFRAASAGHSDLLALAAKFEPFAANPPLIVSQLRDSFATEIRVAVSSIAPESLFWARLRAAFEPLILVRPLHDERFAAVEKALGAGDAVGALGAVKALPQDLQKGLAPWRIKLEARVALDAALRALAAHFAAPSPAISAVAAPAAQDDDQ